MALPPQNKPRRCKRLKQTEETAEFIGIMLGDGNVFSCENEKANVHQVRIATGRKDEEEYAYETIIPLLRNISGIEPRVLIRKNVIYSCINSRKFVEELVRLGFRKGNKIMNRMRIPEWIFSKDRYIRACIRGLVDTDGSVYRLSNHDPHLGRISLKNFNPLLLEDFQKAMLRLGFHPSKIIHKNVFVTRKADLVKYYKEIGSNNPYKRARLALFIAPSSSGQG